MPPVLPPFATCPHQVRHPHRTPRKLIKSPPLHLHCMLYLLMSTPTMASNLLSIQIDDQTNNNDDDNDNFMMYEFKIRLCNRSRSHDWTDCPLAHPGEKARRRDPRKYHYSGNMCADYKNTASCPRGDACEFAHGVFECWLHPAKYRTTPCRDGQKCGRKVCFFAHSRRQLRVLSSLSPPLFLSPTSTLVGPVRRWRKEWLVEELVRRLEEMEMEMEGEPDLEWVEELLVE